MCRPVAVLYYKQVGGLHAQLMQHFVNFLHFPPHSVLHSYNPIPFRPSAKTPPASRSKPFQYGDEEVTPQIQNPRDIAHSRLHSEPSSTVPQGGEEREWEAPSQRADARKTHSEAPYQQVGENK